MSKVFTLPLAPLKLRSTDCGSAVKFTLITTPGVPGAVRSQLSTFSFPMSSMVFSPCARDTFVFFSLIRARYKASNELGSLLAAATFIDK